MSTKSGERQKLAEGVKGSVTHRKPPLGPTEEVTAVTQTTASDDRHPFGPGEPVDRNWDDPWFGAERERALDGLAKTELQAATELGFALSSPINRPQTDLLDAAYAAQIHTFGWPIGLVTDKAEYSPRPRTDGITAEIRPEQRDSYDYWSIRNNGDYYLLQSLFEDTRQPTAVFFNTRIVRTTEALMYANRLYSALGLGADAVLGVRLNYRGLQGRELAASTPNRPLSLSKRIHEDGCESEVAVRLGNIDGSIVDLVIRLASPLFMLFDFTQFPDEVYRDIVENFVQGRVT